MSDPQVRAVAVSNGYEGHFRKVHLSGWHSVQVEGIAQLFETEDKAIIAAYEARERHLFGDGILRWGAKATAARSQAEELFGKVFIGKGRKPVVVERR